MYVSIETALLSIALGYPLAKFGLFLNVFGHQVLGVRGVAGLALAFSISSYFNAIVLFILLRKKYPEIWNTEVLASFVKITLISAVMGVVSWLTMHFAAGQVNMNRFVGVLTQTLATLLVAGAVYFFLSYIFKSEEMRWSLTRKINTKSE
jgi:peptidoglycan biosynthesis protein MviN/MurJ (putative lipid II flippase)